ncbi:MAG: cytochrome c oxidase subunit 3 [Deltaproteobacteria bacterium]|nr:cytochrome c oxidase subunit 3 [Deltaproteobacteria bacterium]
MSFTAPVATGRSTTGIPTARLAMWWLLASEIVIFGGLVAVYLLLRLHNPGWGEEASHTNVWAGAINTFVLLTSSYFIVLGHKYSELKETEKANKFMLLTVLFGFIFLIVKAYEYTTEIMHGFTLFKSVFWSFYYVATAIHATHVIVGMLAIYLISRGVKKGKNLHRTEVVGIYWHFVDIVWIFLFPLLYIAK